MGAGAVKFVNTKPLTDAHKDAIQRGVFGFSDVDDPACQVGSLDAIKNHFDQILEEGSESIAEGVEGILHGLR